MARLQRKYLNPPAIPDPARRRAALGLGALALSPLTALASSGPAAAQQPSASEIAMLRARITSKLRACWRLPSGDSTNMPVVMLRWRLKRDGSLDGDPQVEQPRGDALFRVAAKAAERAVRECAPFDLPADKYSTWRTITWEFDPRAR